MTNERSADLCTETKMLLEQCRANIAELSATAAREGWPRQFVYRGVSQLLTKTVEMMDGLDEFEDG